VSAQDPATQGGSTGLFELAPYSISTLHNGERDPEFQFWVFVSFLRRSCREELSLRSPRGFLGCANPQNFPVQEKLSGGLAPLLAIGVFGILLGEMIRTRVERPIFDFKIPEKEFEN